MTARKRPIRYRKIFVTIGAHVALAFLAAAALAAPAFSPQAPQDASGTIASTGTYQRIWARDENRSGCSVQNQGTHPMSVRVGGTSGTIWHLAAATSPGSGDGGVFYCNWEGVIVTSVIEITGTVADAYAAASE